MQVLPLNRCESATLSTVPASDGRRSSLRRWLPIKSVLTQPKNRAKEWCAKKPLPMLSPK